MIKRFSRLDISADESLSLLPARRWLGGRPYPLREDGEFWLFYLHEVRSDPKPGTSWNLVTTKDLTQFEDHGVSLHHGSEDDLDFNAYTGSIVWTRTGIHHLFYTGQNPRNLGADGAPLQLVMHATSTDGMKTWGKHPELTFGAPDGYESGDWRDPFVFRDEAGRAVADAARCTALRRARTPPRRHRPVRVHGPDDLGAHRAVLGPPALHHPRMPGRVRLGRLVVHGLLRVLRIIHHPLPDGQKPQRPLDCAGSGQHRRPGLLRLKDRRTGRTPLLLRLDRQQGRTTAINGPWQWAGTMSVLEARQNPDGTLGFSFADELVDSFWDEVPVSLDRELPTTLNVPDGYAAVVSDEDLPRPVLRQGSAGDRPRHHRMRAAAALQRRRRPLLRSPPGTQARPHGLRPVAPGHHRRRPVACLRATFPSTSNWNAPATSAPGEHTLEVVVDGDLCVAVLDRQVSLSTRIYDLPEGRIGVFAGEGSVTVTELESTSAAPDN